MTAILIIWIIVSIVVGIIIARAIAGVK